jgi:fructose-bisphosphate aldolase class II
MISSTLALARHGQEKGYAVPAVNIFDDVSLRAVVGAAEEHSSPLIVQVSVKTLRQVGLALMTEMFRAVASDATVPLALHLDHCPDLEVAKSVIQAGWSSLLLDVSTSPLDEAIRSTEHIVKLAHAAGVDVESEIENIIGVEDGVGSEESLNSYTPEVLADAAQRTSADLLAPQLGTAHGAYSSPPVLNPERARKLLELSGRPIVLHGGTGLTDRDFKSFIDAGVSKINISTAIKLAYVNEIRNKLEADRGVTDPLKLLLSVEESVRVETGKHILVFGSDGHAAGASAQGAEG